MTTPILKQNIEAMRREHRAQRSARGLQDRAADAITAMAGSMGFVYIHAVILVVWIVANSGYFHALEFDRSFVGLAGAASVEAIFLSTFILISQNRASKLQDQRADLDLQINLLGERESTQVLWLLRALAQKNGIPLDQEENELEAVIDPEQVLNELSEKPATDARE